MKKNTIIISAAAGLMATCAVSSCTKERTNPFLEDYTTVYEIPPFDKITYDDYLPALREGIRQQKQAVDKICASDETPTFENTIAAFEDAATTLNKVVLVF